MEYVIVTGTSRGIGFELSRLLADAGFKVLALSRNDKPINSLKHENIEAFPFDVSLKEDQDKLFKFLKENDCTVSALINNAGKLINKPFLELTDQEFKSVYEVNVFGVASMTKLVLPFMNKEGHVLTILLAEEFKETGPAFNAFALGAVQTEMLEEAFPGYKAPVSAVEMAEYIMDFALKGQKLYNGKILQVSSSTP